MQILYQDDQLVAVNKPAGLLVHRSAIDRHETRFALQLVRDLIGRRVYPVHRLDKPTSGVLLFALSPEAARSLTEAFTARQPEKTYLAVVRGVLPESGLIDYPLVEEPDRMTDRLASLDKGPQAAVTAYRLLAQVEFPVAVGRYASSRYSLLAASPRTGRKHQLRRHFKHLFHPVIGDTRYGEGRHNRFFRTEFDCHRLLLHAVELAFLHPCTGEQMILTAPLDPSFGALLSRLNWGQAVSPAWLPPHPF